MTGKKSPGGSTYPYYYKGGELFGLHLGSFNRDESGVLLRMREEEAFMIEQQMKIGMWFDFCQTRMTNAVMDAFAAMIDRRQQQMTKVAIVGCSFLDTWRLKRKLRNQNAVPIRYYDDPEDAKAWLVGRV